MEKVVLKILAFIKATSNQGYLSNSLDRSSPSRTTLLKKFMENCLSVEETADSRETQRHSFNVIRDIIKEASNDLRIEPLIRELLPLGSWHKQIQATFNLPLTQTLRVLPLLLDIICTEANSIMTRILRTHI